MSILRTVSGKIKEKFIVDTEKCVGCEICAEVCRFNAVDIVYEESDK